MDFVDTLENIRGDGVMVRFAVRDTPEKVKQLCEMHPYMAVYGRYTESVRELRVIRALLRDDKDAYLPNNNRRISVMVTWPLDAEGIALINVLKLSGEIPMGLDV